MKLPEQPATKVAIKTLKVLFMFEHILFYNFAFAKIFFELEKRDLQYKPYFEVEASCNLPTITLINTNCYIIY